MKGFHEASMKPGTYPCRREVCTDPPLGQNQVIVGVREEPVLEPIQRCGCLRAAKGYHQRLVILREIHLGIVNADQPCFQPQLIAEVGTALSSSSYAKLHACAR